MRLSHFFFSTFAAVSFDTGRMMRILYRFIYITILLLSFTQATRVAAQEMSSIYVETPGLFDKSETFEVDFTQTRQAEYSFPLPVGKVVASSQQGLEIETTKGDAVKAMFEGTVRLSRNIQNFGNVVVVRHPNGFETVYANNAQNLVKVGDKVKAGRQ